MLANDLSLLNLLDSKFTIATRKLQKLYGLNVKPPRPDPQRQPQRIELPEGSHRGGLLGNGGRPGGIVVSPAHQPGVAGQMDSRCRAGNASSATSTQRAGTCRSSRQRGHTLRERLTQHRANPVCASCHSRIDPLGFALENYDVIGRWRTEEAGKPIDQEGELPDGTKIRGPES